MFFLLCAVPLLLPALYMHRPNVTGVYQLTGNYFTPSRCSKSAKPRIDLYMNLDIDVDDDDGTLESIFITESEMQSILDKYELIKTIKLIQKSKRT